MNSYVILNTRPVHYRTYNSNSYIEKHYYDTPPSQSELLRKQLAMAALMKSKPKELPKLSL